MGSRTRSPVAAGPERIFADPGAVARRVRDRLRQEVPESARELSAEEEPAERVLEGARRERDRVLAAGAAGLEKLAGGRADEIRDDESFGMEAIVLLEGRPAILVENQDFAAQGGDWAVLDERRDAIRRSIARVGRVEVGGHPSLDWLGTAFVVGDDVVMTNRHVAAEFARQDGAGWTFQGGMSARITPGEDCPGPSATAGGPAYRVAGVIGIHPDLDLALLRIEPDPVAGPPPTPFAVAATGPGALEGRPVYCVGYPAYDGRRNEPAAMRRIFMDVYNVKRLQPGTVTELLPGGAVLAHDCSTLGGNSGSPVVDLFDERVVGLHFGGRYGVGNYAVPLWRFTDDPLLRSAGVNFV
ncbi:trypsin-like peptidase domain-containing protein [Streptomyces yaizuensis]|uniref:Serine protease n=1 Tax=Streptomyces yaizuensis TaxID=2989713 RepID=A0ABQ5NSK4_9ACTN|nr:trypsin-like peptidase domain-containing protein [Streptomyces sp. YSPA8]GLF93144.1 serine protease [Streptomyces sp. YSPA8]